MKNIYVLNRSMEAWIRIHQYPNPRTCVREANTLSKQLHTFHIGLVNMIETKNIWFSKYN